MHLSVGICAYNEEDDIGNCLESLSRQEMKDNDITEITVVSSGSTDKTEEIVRDFSKKDARVKLLAQKKREGKASAVNLFLKNATGDIMVLQSADVIAEPNTIENLVSPFSDEKVGMTGGRPVPVNKPDNFLGFTINLIWNLHHKISMERTKTGELVAFRRIIGGIPTDTCVDEAWIESAIRKNGFSIVYVPDAVVRNKGPETVSDLIRQRKRISIGHLHLRETQGYYPSSMDKSRVIKMVFREMIENPARIHWIAAAVLLELYIRANANFDFYVLKKNPYRWEIAKTTKKIR